MIAGANLTDAFERLLAEHPEWPEATRGAVRDLAWSTLRDYGRGDAILARLLHSPPPVEIRALLLVALQRLTQRPEQAHTMVDQAVGAAAEPAYVISTARPAGSVATATTRGVPS